MSTKKPTYEELKKKLAKTEALLTKLQKKEDKSKNMLDLARGERDIAKNKRRVAVLDTKEYLEAYKTSEQNFKNLIDASPLGIRIVTEDGALIYANQAILDICGYKTAEELAAVPRNELYTPESYKAHQERKRKRKLKEYAPLEYEIDIRRPDGEVRNLQVFRREVMWGGEQQFMAMYQDITEHKRAEEALKESEERFHTIVEHSNDGIVFIQDGIVRYCNSKMLEIGGYSQREVLGKPFIDFVAPEHKEKVFDIYSKRIAGKKTQERYELNLLAKDGGIIYTEISASLVNIKQETVDIAIVRDITERKKAEETLVDEATRRRILIEQSRDGIVILDQDGAVYEANQRFADMLGYTMEEVQKLHVFNWEFLYPKERVVEMIRTVDEKGDHFETQHRRKDGTTYDVEISTNGATFGGQKLIFCVCRDITEQKRMEQSIRESEEKFSKAFLASPAIVAITTIKDSKYIDINDSYTQITGYSREEVIGKKATSINIWANEQDRARMLRILKEQGRVSKEEFDFHMKSGEIRTWLFSSEPITIGGEECLIGVAVDITEREQAEKVIRESEERFRTLFETMVQGVIYHDSEGRVISANPAAQRILGLTLDEMVGKTSLDPQRKRLHENGSEFSSEEHPSIVALRTGKPVKDVIMAVYNPIENDYRWIINSAIPEFREGEKTPYRVYSTFTDITDRKRAEEELERDREEIKLIMDSSPALVFYKDKEGKFLRVNRAFAEAMNMPEKDFVGKTVFDLYSADIAQGMTNDDREVYVSGSSKLNIIEQYESATGLRLVQTDKVPVLDKNGKAIAMIGFAQDITEHKQAEEKIVYLASFPEVNPNPIIELDEEGNIKYLNPAAIKTFPDLAQKGINHPYLAGWMQLVNEIQDSKSSYTILREVIVNGLFYEQRIFVTKENQIRIYGTDITERKQAEEAIKESEEKFNKAFHASLNLMAIISLDEGRIIDVNAAYCNSTGYKRKELTGHIATELNLWVNPEQRKEFYRVIATEGQLENQEVLLRTKTGEIRTFLFSAEKISLRGTPCIVIGALDITGRKLAEQRINYLNQTLRSIRNINQLITREKDRDKLLKGVCDTLVKSRSFLTSWIVLLDESNKLITYAMSGFKGDFTPILEEFKKGNAPPCAQKALKKTQVITTEDPRTMCAGCPMIKESADLGSMTIRLEYSGNIYGILCASLPKEILIDENEVSLFQEVATDISFALYNMELQFEYERMEQERLRAAKLESIGTLAGGIAHDFNNLLTGIMGNIGLVKTNISPNEATYEMLEEAEKAAMRARDLTQQLLTFARGGKPIKKPVQIAEIIKVSATFALRGSKAKLELILPDDLWPIEADEGQISQVINNLVINADEAMPEAGTLKIKAENVVLKKTAIQLLPGGNYVCIDIMDTGIGISDEHLQRIFEPYFTTKQRGSGLGLTSAYSIVRNHGGIILAESTQTKGSTFHVYLPATQKPLVKGGKKMTAERAGQAGGKILVMDDEEIIRKMLKNMLSLAGYTVELSAHGAEALEKYQQAIKIGDPFNAVIMDLTIPGGMGGKETIQKLLEIDPKATAIVSSGYATDAIMSDYKTYGFKAVIAKPYSAKQLQETLSGLLTRKKK